MTSAPRLLPRGFESLEPFVASWAIDDLSMRDAMRGSATPEERKAFYAVASDLAEAALDHLDAKPFESLDDSEARLMQLMLSLAHVALAEEIQGDHEPAHTELRAFMPFVPDRCGT